MLTTVLLIYLVSSVSADDGYAETEIMPRCSDTPGTRMTFTAVDGYTGRYIAELCTERRRLRDFNSPRKREEWNLHLTFYETPDYCNVSNHKKDVRAGKTHSINVEWLSSKHNCSSNQTVCMSATFDFIFSACYAFGSRFIGSSGHPLQYFYFNITNNHTKQEFSDNLAHVYPTYFPDYMSLTWYTGVPPMAYKILLCNDSQNNWDSCPELSNCSITDKTTIQCSLAPPYGCYSTYLKHSAPWIQGEFFSQKNVYYHFCRNETILVSVSGSVWAQWVWVAVGLCAAVLVVGAAGACACRSMDLRKRQQKALWMWLAHRNGAAAGAGAGAGAVSRQPCRDVLVLYARECSAAARAVAALRTALQYVVEGEVYDIFEPAVMAECASAPYEWVRRKLQRRDTAVLLLQTPALHALYAHATDQDKLSPLLGRRGRVAARAPQFGDALLQYALRLAAESATPRDNYNKYFIATVSDLPSEVLPCVVPYRRYALPGAVRVLLRDLAAPRRAAPVPTPLIDNFCILLNEFVDLARDNPNYLSEELMAVET